MSNRRFLFSGSGNGERLKFYPNMKAIIAEKPSVGMDIARVVGATEKKDGYCIGNGYMVTWALGHLVSLALPGTYGYTKTAADDLPMIPEPFRLVARQIKTAKGMVTDITANKQLKTIDEVFSKCDSIIVATDAGREGELIFRWIYDYLGYTKPFQRLWISSLTDEAIREGMENLRDGSDYDSLYAAADSRAKADWLVGMNASRALAIASGSANNSIGRVQTPTLAMICARFKVYTLNSLMESLTGEKFSYRQMTDFYNGKPLNVKRMETPDGVQKDKAVKFDKETGKFSFSDIRQERKRGLKM